MAPNILPPSPHALLPPLLACLPTAFVSPRPPPSLLSLLSPILRQRITLLSQAPGQASDASWLHLLCWDSEAASDLVATAESTTFEPHPVSGEVELGDVEGPAYRRLDQETLQARFQVPDFNLEVVYVWCEWDRNDGGNGWLVSEVRALGPAENETTGWWESMREANERSKDALTEMPDEQNSRHMSNQEGALARDEANKEDDYWAQYDRAPEQESPEAQPVARGPLAGSTEAEYFSRYSQVQPALDNNDPSGLPEVDALASSDDRALKQQPNQELERQQGEANGRSTSREDAQADNLVQPKPDSRRASVVLQLNDSTEAGPHTDLAIQQHMSTSLKSLFRLARASGMEQHEFKRIVHTELDTLCMMGEDY